MIRWNTFRNKARGLSLGVCAAGCGGGGFVVGGGWCGSGLIHGDAQDEVPILVMVVRACELLVVACAVAMWLRQAAAGC